MKINIFVFVYTPKDENKDIFGLGVYGSTTDGKELFGISKAVERKRGRDYNVLGAVLGMEKAIELGYNEVEVICSNSNSVKKMTKPISNTINTMGDVRTKFYKLKHSFRIAAFRYVREALNKGGKKMAKIGAGERIIFKWV